MIASLLSNGGATALFVAGLGFPTLAALAFLPERLRRFSRANSVAVSVGVLAWIGLVLVVREVAFARVVGCDRVWVLDALLMAGIGAASLGAASGAAAQRFWRTPTTRLGAGVALLVTIAADACAVWATAQLVDAHPEPRISSRLGRVSGNGGRPAYRRRARRACR